MAEIDQRAEDEGEQDEAQPEHEGEHDREPLVDDVGVVDVLGGGTTDQHGGVGAVEGGGDQVGPQPVESAAGLAVVGVADQRDGDDRDLTVLGDLSLCRPEVGVALRSTPRTVRWRR